MSALAAPPGRAFPPGVLDEDRATNLQGRRPPQERQGAAACAARIFERTWDHLQQTLL